MQENITATKTEIQFAVIDAFNACLDVRGAGCLAGEFFTEKAMANYFRIPISNSRELTDDAVIPSVKIGKFVRYHLKSVMGSLEQKTKVTN